MERLANNDGVMIVKLLSEELTPAQA